MYTELASYRIVIALLKEYGIRHCVISAGSRNVPFAHSVETDPDFTCCSVVDERSAGYFALGLAQELGEPVVISCTSSTATCNYWPPVAEAFYQGVPLVVLTSDRDPAMLGQWEDQMIDQVGMFDRHVRKSVNLPIVEGADDWLFCQRLVNEALLELDHGGTGPVHINVQSRAYNNNFTERTLPEVTRIRRVSSVGCDDEWAACADRLASSRRVLVVPGQMSAPSERLVESLRAFCGAYEAAVAADYMANLPRDLCFNPMLATEAGAISSKDFDALMPEVVVSLGGNIASGLKGMLRARRGSFEHWSVMPDGRVCDMYKSETRVFECEPEHFFRRMAEVSRSKGTGSYQARFRAAAEAVELPDEGYSNIVAIKRMVERIPSGSILHLAINSAIRIANFSKVADGVKVYANIGTHGIDGCLSSLAGQAAATGKPAYLVIGDLSFFYDMNALRIRHLSDKVRILLINNEGGEEFYYNGSWVDQASDLHTTARHHTKAEGWVRECGVRYLAAHDRAALDAALDEFFDDGAEGPVLLEVFTEMASDSAELKGFFERHRSRDTKQDAVRGAKSIAKALIGEENARRLGKILKG